MAEPRTQGRPRADARRFSRDKLLEQTRVAMNRPPKTDLQRRDIAEIAGVTPALINYYFPDKWQLVEAASLPIIESYAYEVTNLLGSVESNDYKLRNLTRLYVLFNKESGYLLDYYIEAVDRRKNAQGINLLRNTHMRIVDYLRSTISSGHMRDVNPEFLNAVLWSVCKYISQHSGENSTSTASGYMTLDDYNQHANAIYSLLFNGFRP